MGCVVGAALGIVFPANSVLAGLEVSHWAPGTASLLAGGSVGVGTNSDAEAGGGCSPSGGRVVGAAWEIVFSAKLLPVLAGLEVSPWAAGMATLLAGGSVRVGTTANSGGAGGSLPVLDEWGDFWRCDRRSDVGVVVVASAGFLPLAAGVVGVGFTMLGTASWITLGTRVLCCYLVLKTYPCGRKFRNNTQLQVFAGHL